MDAEVEVDVEAELDAEFAVDVDAELDAEVAVDVDCESFDAGVEDSAKSVTHGCRLGDIFNT